MELLSKHQSTKSDNPEGKKPGFLKRLFGGKRKIQKVLLHFQKQKQILSQFYHKNKFLHILEF